jgi:hypothetical protein
MDTDALHGDQDRSGFAIRQRPAYQLDLTEA